MNKVGSKCIKRYPIGLKYFKMDQIKLKLFRMIKSVPMGQNGIEWIHFALNGCKRIEMVQNTTK